MDEFIIGIDEAGRGPVIGPMVMVAAAITAKEEKKLRLWGVKDSKLLTPKQREELFDQIMDLCEIEVSVVPPSEIDEAIISHSFNLNLLEAKHSAFMINDLADRLKIRQAILDCPSASIESYERTIKKQLTKDVKIICEYKADLNHPVVAAASIIAKVTRDRELERISAIVGENIGSGYPSDERTMNWLEKNHNKDFGFIRRSWASVKNIQNRKEQRKLFEFNREEKHKSELDKFEKLVKLGFQFEEPKTKYELIRMKGPPETKVTIIKYTTGKLLIQGAERAKMKAEALLQSQGIK